MSLAHKQPTEDWYSFAINTEDLGPTKTLRNRLQLNLAIPVSVALGSSNDDFPSRFTSDERIKIALPCLESRFNP
jgi:hypothetical protein